MKKKIHVMFVSSGLYNTIAIKKITQIIIVLLSILYITLYNKFVLPQRFNTTNNNHSHL